VTTTGSVGAAIAALRAGRLAVIPTDTVYGLVADGESEAAARRLYAAKGRESIQPTAIVLSSLDAVLDRVPELPDDAVRAARALLPGPVTLVLPNPAQRFRWLNAERPEAIGVRVPELRGPGREVLDVLECLVATSANLPGSPDPRRVEEVPAAIAATVETIVDGGELPGVPSTVIDLTGSRPRILREGAIAAAETLEQLGWTT
jgi:L-threonylcarbamoyladenylate synthase